MAWTMEAIGGIAMLIEYDFKGIINSVNTKICSVTGYLKEELIGQHHSILVDGSDSVMSEVYKNMWIDLKNGKPVEGVFNRIAKDGVPFTVKGLCYPVSNKDGQPLKIVELMVEVTDIVEKR